MADKIKVLMLQPIHEDGIKLFDDRFELLTAKDPSPAAVKAELAGVQGIIVRIAGCPKEIIDAAPDLKVIAKHGVGPDNIDVAAATERGILVLNTPDANAVSVAEHTVAAIGALAKRALYNDRAMRAGNWKVRGELKATDLDGKVLGLVGTGKIGTLVAKKCMGAFDMRVIAYDPYVKPEVAAANGITLVGDLAQLFREADVVSLHTPLTPQTRNLVSAELLAAMKPSAFLVNFARGEVVDEAALIAALQAGKIAGAALDVFQQEPPANDNPLFALDNVILSPHSAAQTKECVIRMSTTTAQGVIDALTGVRPRYIYNPEALSAHK
ncbi:MAG TPA: hydroxyacid dehydrogenase [Symbiobacteriaceae bacterium]|nr:hydroxyacid dehydrogenase [Symbiobacteriaceae bacterium]